MTAWRCAQLIGGLAVIATVLAVAVRALWPSPVEKEPYEDDLDRMRAYDMQRAAQRRVHGRVVVDHPDWYRQDAGVRW